MPRSDRKIAIEKMRVILDHLQTIKERAVNLGLVFSETDSPVAPAMELTLEMLEALEVVLNEVYSQM